MSGESVIGHLPGVVLLLRGNGTKASNGMAPTTLSQRQQGAHDAVGAALWDEKHGV